MRYSSTSSERPIGIAGNQQAYVVFVVSVSLGLDQSRTLAATSSLDRLVAHFKNRRDILPVNHHAGNSVSACASRDTWLAMTERKRSCDRVTVVLAKIDHGKLPESAHVDGFMKRSLVHRAIAKEAKTHLLGLAHLGAQTDPGSERNSRRRRSQTQR